MASGSTTVDDVLAVGQKVQVELKEIDPRGKLSLAAVMAEDMATEPAGSEVPAVEDAVFAED